MSTSVSEVNPNASSGAIAIAPESDHDHSSIPPSASRSGSPSPRERRDSIESNHSSYSVSRSSSHDVLPGHLPSIPTRIPLKVLGTRGLYLAAPTPFLRSRFTHYFPQRETQFAALIAAVVVVIVAAIWTSSTIQGKWIENIHNPTTTLSNVRLPSVPAVPGMMTLFHANYWFNQTEANSFDISATEGTIVNPNTPLPTWIPPNPVPKHGYNFHEVWLSTRQITGPATSIVKNHRLGNYGCGPDKQLPVSTFLLEFCVPYNYDEIVKSSADWPLNFQSSLDSLCVFSYSLLDDRAYIEVDSYVKNYTNIINFNRQRFQDPYLMLSLVDLPSVRSYLIENGMDTDALLGASFWSRPIHLPYSHRSSLGTVMTKRIDVHGMEEWRTTLEFGGSVRLEQEAIDEAWDEFIATNPHTAAKLFLDPNLQLDPTKPNATRKLYQEICIGPDTFQIPVVTETRTYGVISFLTDLGGFLSLLSVAFLVLFPVAQSLILPRRFLFAQLYNLAKQICCDDTGDMSAIAEEDEEKELQRMELKEKFEQQEEENHLEQLKQAREQKIRAKLQQQQQLEKQQLFYDNGESKESKESKPSSLDSDLRRLSRLNSQLGEFDSAAIDTNGDRGKHRKHASSFEMSLLDHQHADASSERL